jgi:photosystem II stability/assembly factor-like uncharacterized protein
MKFALASLAATASAEEWKVIQKAFSAVTIGIGFQSDRIGWTTFTDGASLPQVVKTADGGVTWNKVQNMTGIHFLTTGIAANKGYATDVAVVGAVESDMWSIDGERFVQSIGAPIVSQDAKFQGGKLWIGGPKGPCHSKTGATYKCLSVPLKYDQTGRYVSAPSEDVIYFTAGSWPSDQTERVVQQGSKKIHRMTQRLRLVHDEETNEQKYEMGPEERTTNDDPPADSYVAELWKSTDGGATWKNLITDEGTYYFNDIHCIDETHCVAVAEGFANDGSADPGARVFLTTDGETFNEVHKEATTGGESLMTARMLSQTEYWAAGSTKAGGFTAPALALHSTDGGQTHTSEATNIKGNMFTSLDFLSAEHGYATSITAAQVCNLLEFGGSAPPAPTPTPTPGATHYEKPPCQDDEAKASVTGTGGSVCAPSCDGMDCPSDVPEGVTAEATCALSDQSGGKYCALLCDTDDACDSDGGAICAHPQAGAPGICVYPDSSNGLPVHLAATSLTV